MSGVRRSVQKLDGMGTKKSIGWLINKRAKLRGGRDREEKEGWKLASLNQSAP
jgi:hypothetical protein